VGEETESSKVLEIAHTSYTQGLPHWVFQSVNMSGKKIRLSVNSCEALFMCSPLKILPLMKPSNKIHGSFMLLISQCFIGHK
jgi:hypothetical protein